MRAGLLPVVILSAALLASACRPSAREDLPADRVAKEEPQEQEQDNPLGANAGCYVCHIPFVGEELTVTHLEAGQSCVHCHGTSEGHANDEDIGATPPDVIIPHDQVNAFCRTCHETHDVPAEKVIARWTQRSKLQAASQPALQTAVCTDCHGNHTISGSG